MVGFPYTKFEPLRDLTPSRPKGHGTLCFMHKIFKWDLTNLLLSAYSDNMVFCFFGKDGLVMFIEIHIDFLDPLYCSPWRHIFSPFSGMEFYTGRFNWLCGYLHSWFLAVFYCIMLAQVSSHTSSIWILSISIVLDMIFRRHCPYSHQSSNEKQSTMGWLHKYN